ncbi:MAG: hypothetical protein Q8S73_20315 [Deltaproteobacteria bacterium]|nr:hypothetical protein [Myxococcales bacterium]MDP3216464.1 hypothetical protein [Deltaproteobacteria bacterium]
MSPLPTTASIRESRELSTVLARHWRSIDDGSASAEGGFERFEMLVLTIFDEAYRASTSRPSYAGHWHACGWALLTDRALARRCVGYVWREGTVAGRVRPAHGAAEGERVPGRALSLASIASVDRIDPREVRDAFAGVLAGLDPRVRAFACSYYRARRRDARVGEPLRAAAHDHARRLRDAIGATILDRHGARPTRDTDSRSRT